MDACSHAVSNANLLTDADLQTPLPLDLSILDSPPQVRNLGYLGNLPTELLLVILEKLPLTSLIRFRNTSQSARHFVDTIPKFKQLVQHAPQAIRGIVALQTTVEITLPSLYKILEGRHCTRCGQLVQYFWLPTVSRMCFACVHIRLLPLTKSELIRTYPLTREELLSVPSFRFPATSFTGGRNGNIFKVSKPHILYDTMTAKEILCARTRVQVLSLPCIFYESSKVEKLLLRSKQEKPIVLDKRHLPRRIRRTMGLVIAPWISPAGSEMGVYCNTCLYTKDQHLLYTHAGLREHLENCRVQPISGVALGLQTLYIDKMGLRLAAMP